MGLKNLAPDCLCYWNVRASLRPVPSENGTRVSTTCEERPTIHGSARNLGRRVVRPCATKLESADIIVTRHIFSIFWQMAPPPISPRFWGLLNAPTTYNTPTPGTQTSLFQSTSVGFSDIARIGCITVFLSGLWASPLLIFSAQILETRSVKFLPLPAMSQNASDVL